MIRIIAFDLDDTLWDVKPVLIKAEKQLDLFLRQSFPTLKYNVTSMRSLRHEVLEEDPHLVNRITEYRRRIIEKAMIKSNINHAKKGSMDAMEIFLEARNQIEFFDDVVPTLKLLSSKFTLGVLTNGNADINRIGLADYFSFSFSAEEVGAAKPAKDLFHIALKHTNSSPSEMVYVGDDLLLDIVTANQVGIHSVWLNWKDKLKPTGHEARETKKYSPSETIGRIGELPSAVEKIIRCFPP